MTITPPRGAGGTTTRSVRGRNRRRQNTAGEPRHAAANQTELAPLRRRGGGRHAAEEPAAESVAGITETEITEVGFPAVGFPAPGRDVWATDAGQELPAASLTDPLEASGVVDGRAFWAGSGGWADPDDATAADGWAEPGGGTAADGWAAASMTDTALGTAWTDTAGAGAAGATGWDDGAGTGAFGEPSPIIGGSAPAGLSGGSGPTGLSGSSAPAGLAGGRDGAAGEPAPGVAGVEPVGREASCDDGGARGAYRIGNRIAERRRGGRRAHARRTRSAYLSAALVRCGLYLGPLSVAVAAADTLGRVAWPVPAVMLLLGWTAAQGLTGVGVTVARRGGPAAAARTVGAGFAGVIALWCALVWIAPDAMLGPDRLLAATVGLGGLITLGSVTAALVTRAEGAVAGWYVPCWLLAATVMATAAGVAEAALVPVETLLPAGIVAVAVRAFRPALLPAVLSAPIGRTPRLTSADRRRALAYLVIGAAQAISVTLLWRGGPAVMPLPATLPLLLAVPLLEGLIGWHTDRLDAGLDSAETPEEFDRHVRNVTAITLAGLVPPLAAGCGLLIAAYRLPYGFSAVPSARDAVLALAAGTLLGGVFAVTFLLAARSRHGIAATLAAIPPLAAAVLALFAPPAGLLPAAGAVLAATHLAGLLIVASTAADLRRTP